jgi:tRNA A-37 threonylcarbamoyl transferase component Bud32
VVKTYLGARALERRDRELETLRHWLAHGYRVPEVQEGAFEGLENLEGPCLVMARLEGRSLEDLLRDPHRAPVEKLERVRQALLDNARRHARAMELADPRLVHHDANSGNLFVAPDGIYHLDFETPLPRRPAAESAAIEVAKLARWIARDLGRERLDEVLGAVVEAYRGQRELLELLVRRIRGRPWQLFHRWRDRRRRRRDPGEVTKYDVADGIGARLGN